VCGVFEAASHCAGTCPRVLPHGLETAPPQHGGTVMIMLVGLTMQHVGMCYALLCWATPGLDAWLVAWEW